MLSHFDKTKSGLPEQYSINLMWLNKARNPDNKYIYACSKDDLMKSIEVERGNKAVDIEKEAIREIKKIYDNQIDKLLEEKKELHSSLGEKDELSRNDVLNRIYEISNHIIQLQKEQKTEEKARIAQVDVQNKLEKLSQITITKINNITDESPIMDLFLSKAIKWEEANPGAQVHLWYDGETVTDEQLKATQAMLDKAKSNVKLKNIRDIEYVKLNPDCFCETIPFYFRIDVLKLIISVKSIEKDGQEAAIFSDLYVGDLRKDKDRMNKTELFNPEVMKKLKQTGVLFGQDREGKLENQFMQVFNKPGAIMGLKLFVDASLNRMVTHLNLADKLKDSSFLKALGSELFFEPLMAQLPSLLFHLNDKETYPIQVNTNLFVSDRDENWIDYEPLSHGCIPLGNVYMKGNHGICPNSLDMSLITELSQRTKVLNNVRKTELSRGMVDVRGGSSHNADLSVLEKKKPPCNGEQYCCEFYVKPEIKLEPKTESSKAQKL